MSPGAQVLLRALRDFNLGKLTADDEGIFLGLLNDLFPRTAEHVPRAVDHAFEVKVLSPNLEERRKGICQRRRADTYL